MDSTMVDSDGPPIDGIGGFDRSDDDGYDGMDDEFANLEYFDSNPAIAQPERHVNPESSEQNGQAPVATMSTDEPPSSQTKKSKGRKDKKKRREELSATGAKQPREEGHHKRAKRKSSLDTATANDAEATLPAEDPQAGASGLPLLGEEASAPSKRKRRSSGGSGGKRRKKTKSQDAELDGVIGEHTEDNAAAFLRKDTGSGLVIADGDTTGPDPQGSPTDAHLRRRSQSREARSRENSTPREIGTGNTSEDEENRIKRNDDESLENLARQAWKEHINGNAEIEADITDGNPVAADVEMAGAAVPEANTEAQTPTTAPLPKRTSTRKKSKPTYFDRPQEADEQNQDAAASLPSPSAMTPKPRRRAKTATKKSTKSQEPVLSQPMHGASDEEDDSDAPKGRRNRMAGYKKGRFSDEELERISQQVKAYAEENELSQTEVNEMIHAPGGSTAGEGHAQLWSRLFAECPDRHRQKIINITRKKFHNFVARGTWTPEQDAELRSLIKIHSTRWSKIAGIINRHPEDLRDRYRNYIVCGEFQRKDAWDAAEEERLTQYIMESMTLIDEMRAKQPNRKYLKKSYEELIDWQLISEQMDRTRSRLQCITKWKAMNFKTNPHDKLASQQPNAQISFTLERARRQITDMPAEERYRLVLAIASTQAGKDSKIPWQRLCDKQYRNKWHRATQVLLWYRLKKTVPGWERHSVRDCAQYLIDAYNQSGELPDVDGDDYNNAEENECVQAATAPSSNTKKSRAQKTHPVSGEFVVDSDAEEDETGNVEGHDELEDGASDAQDDDMQIDPALAEASQPQPELAPEAEAEASKESSLASEAEAEAAKKSSPAKKTPAKKTATYGRKKDSAGKGLMLTQDPIEDVEISQAAPAETPGQGSDMEDQRPKKKTPGKFKTSGVRDKKRAASPVAPAYSSDMDDMEDIPA